MKIIFAGTPPFAAKALQALLDCGHEVCLVLSQPDRPSGRGMKLTPSAVKALAQEHGIAVQTPQTLSVKRGGEEIEKLHALLREKKADLMVVAAYGMLLPQEVLDIPVGIGPRSEVKCVNIHASLLPRWRGAAPISRAIEAGDKDFGVTLMKMDAGLDTGPILMQKSFPIASDETTNSLTEKVASLGADMLVEMLANPANITITPQPTDGVTYAHKLMKPEGKLDFSLPAEVLERKIRAFSPFPSSFTEHNGTQIKIWQATVVDQKGVPGQILKSDSHGVIIACGQGALCATVLQRPGKPKMPAQQFLQGYPLKKGEQLQ